MTYFFNSVYICVCMHLCMCVTIPSEAEALGAWTLSYRRL